MRKPNFFIVGAPKCGTTSMYMLLRQHQDIFMPEQKEPGFFGSDLRYRYPRVSKRKYISYFSKAKEEKCVGEATPSYLYSKEAAKEIEEFSPKARIIIILRNPVDMLYSLHSQLLYGGNENIVDFEQALRAEENRKRGKRIPKDAGSFHSYYYHEKVKYAEQVRRYFDAFGRESVHIIIFDDFIRDTENVYRQTLQFLGVNPAFQPTFKIFNPNKRARSRFLRRIMKSYSLRMAVSTFIPRVLLRKIYLILRKLNTRYLPRAPMSQELRRRLQGEFKDEVEKLGALLGRDLTLWSRE